MILTNTIPTVTAVTMVALVTPAMAHTTVVSGQVAGTWHIDPDHHPKAGEPARIWVALTRQGGSPIAFDRCVCRLLIYPIPGDQPLLTPELKAITAEQHQNIPSADVIFPQPGAYRLSLQGAPKQAGDFTPFTLNYTVTVSAGTASVQPITTPNATHSISSPQPQKALGPSPSRIIASLALPIVLLAGLGLGVIRLAWQRRHQSRS